MVDRSQNTSKSVSPSQDTHATAEPAGHPAWCDPARCTAGPARQARGYRPGLSGEHNSAPIPLNLTTAFTLPAREGIAWLTQACLPWRCDTFLHIRIADAEFSMSAPYAGQLIADLSALLATAEEVH